MASQISNSFLKKAFNELRVTESETYGLNFPWNSQGFNIKGDTIQRNPQRLANPNF